MNPPSALFGAMNRERKPFTYTPGGLDLSEIKSERMAKRLMRNAMNQGVPEIPVQQIQSPTTPTTLVALPNFNCLPVQVFPAFNLPANPKSLLRTRSVPEHPKEPIQRAPPSSQFPYNKPSGIQTQQSSPYEPQLNTSFVPQINSSQNRPASIYEYNIGPNNASIFPKTNYGSNGATMPFLPEISYEAEYCQAPFRTNNEIIIPTKSDDISVSEPEKTDIKVIISENDNDIPVTISVCPKNDESDIILIKTDTIDSDFTIQPISNIDPRPASIETMPVEDEVTSDSEQTVKVVKKQVKKEQKIENGNQNGDANVEAELVVKLPTKKSAAKTETKVEVSQTTLPDGTVEEVKVTTTRTTIDGRTEIKTKTEKKIIPKEEVEEVEEEEEEEQEETEAVVEEAEETVEEPTVVVVKKTVKETPVVENGQTETIIKKEERTETATTKKVVIVQKEESEEEEEEVEESEPVVVTKAIEKPVVKEEVEEVVEVEEEVKETETVEETKKEEVEQEEVVTVQVKKPEPPKQEEEEEEEVEEEYEEAEEESVEKKEVKEETKVVEATKQEDVESEYTEEEYESEKEEAPIKEPEPKPTEPEPKEEKAEPVAETQVEEKPRAEEVKPEPKEEKQEEPAPIPSAIPEPRIPLREPSIPLEKVEEVEIKPIGAASEVISKTHTENTEIITNTAQNQTGPLSTQTEYSRVENIVTVNRTTKALDHSYEQMTQAGIPTVRTYFAPSRERIGASPTPSKPYQPIYAAEPPTERRHSLLLDRLSTERQLPTSDIYQNTNSYQYNQSYDQQQRQWSQEPQSEILTVSNVKPSKITNSQWYQQNNRENVIYNNVSPSAGVPPPAATPAPISQPWSQPPPQPQPQQQYQPTYIDNTAQERTTTNTYQQNNYPAYVPKPTNWVNDVPSINTNQLSFINKDTTESYQTTKSTQQYSSSYVPPPWEQDSNYVLENTNQNYYQPPPQSNSYTASPNQGWKPTPPPAKFTKPPPTAYIPPAPNQSFVKAANALEPPRTPGRKTYYSEYERRYITVPESTYIPSETAKYQPQPSHNPQPDPSPQYYYDNNEPSEKVEHEWRKELREFTEKTSQTTEQTTVNPPWEQEAKYANAPVAYTPTSTWSQTLRPRSWRERSFEAEYVGSQELPKTSTLGRSRPLSSYAKSETPVPDRARGVSVDRYNANYYQSPILAEHPPAPTHTLTPTPTAKAYHNPNVPAYHAHPRASAEPREQSVPYPQARLWGSDARDTPVQSRSFKYLQWMTGTDD